ncbi:hypothetical protein ACH4ND_27350 [Streptomyces sp. NPDC017179]|uniref:hypothetical protein n=1 Tax=Streptomyces sp. NPDC017179 TaxID=3364979 RepID=UPI0037A6C857
MASGEGKTRDGTRVEYRTPDRKGALLLSPLMVAWGFFSLVRVGLGHFSGFVDVLGLALGVLAPFLLNTSLGKTVLDDRGIHAWRPLWRRTVRWQDVLSITTEEKSSQGSGAHRVRVRRHKGGALWLPAPYVELRATKAEMDRFAAQAAEITTRWRARTAADGS